MKTRLWDGNKFVENYIITPDGRPLIQTKRETHISSAQHKYFTEAKLTYCSERKDKNGFDVFEGDVVSLDGLLGKVVFSEGQFFVETLDGKPLKGVAPEIVAYKIVFEHCEVVGNVFESNDFWGFCGTGEKA